MVHVEPRGNPSAGASPTARLAAAPNLAVVPPCAGCGVCCHLTVELGAGDSQVPAALTVEYDGVRYMDQLGNGACVALDPATRLCTIYAQRPAVCRSFERASERCRAVLERGKRK